MGIGQETLARLDVRDMELAIHALNGATRQPQPRRERSWWLLFILAVTFGFIAYDFYLMCEILVALSPLITSLAGMSPGVIFAVPQLIALLLPPLALAMVSLNWRGDRLWLQTTAVMSLLGLLTAILEACAYAIG